MAATTSTIPDLPAASGLTGQTTDLPQPGEFPDLDAQTQVPIIIGVTAAFITISSIVVALRLYTRYRLIKAAGEDDVTICVSQILSAGLATTTILQSANGLGRHTWMVAQSDRTRQLQLLLATEIIYNAAGSMTKVSLLLQYRRIFRGFRTRMVCLCLMVFVVAWCTVAIVLDAFACTPMAILNTKLKDTCLASLLVWSLTSAVNIVTNFAVVVVPIPATWALRLHTKQRVVLTVLFGFGFCTGIVAIARIVTVKNAALSLDTSWDSSAISYFSVIEVNVGILCACIITLRPLLADMFPSLIKSSYGNPGVYGPGDMAIPTAGIAASRTKKSWRDTMTHADQGIYGLADLEVEQALNGSQEGLTGVRYFEPAHFSRPEQPALPRMLTSITGGEGGREGHRRSVVRPEATRIKTRSGDIMVTRETTIEEEMRTVSPTSPLRAEKEDPMWGSGPSSSDTTQVGIERRST